MSEKTKKIIRVSLAFSQVVVQSLIVYYTYQGSVAKFSKKSILV
ncbi:TPA: hypothetical protein ACMUSF_002699 [Enterococcus faecium]